MVVRRKDPCPDQIPGDPAVERVARDLTRSLEEGCRGAVIREVAATPEVRSKGPAGLRVATPARLDSGG